MPLNDTTLRNLKATGSPAKYADFDGLYLYLSASGGKLWRMDYRFAGKRKTLSFGAYPAVSLKDARNYRDAAREQLAKGIDPNEAKKQAKAETLAAAKEAALTKRAGVFAPAPRRAKMAKRGQHLGFQAQSSLGGVERAQEHCQAAR